MAAMTATMVSRKTASRSMNLDTKLGSPITRRPKADGASPVRFRYARKSRFRSLSADIVIRMV